MNSHTAKWDLPPAPPRIIIILIITTIIATVTLKSTYHKISFIESPRKCTLTKSGRAIRVYLGMGWRRMKMGERLHYKMVLLGQMGIFTPVIIVMVSRVWLCQNWSNCKLWIMQLISYQLYIKKAVKKKQLYYFHQKWITSNFMKITVKFSQEKKLL